MRAWTALVGLMVLAAALAGCTGDPDRSIESEAEDRERWAKDHNAYDPVAILTGPATLAPGALVLYSAFGSHDPDFFGADDGRQRNQAQSDAGFHAEAPGANVHFDWHGNLIGPGPGLGVGIRQYEWTIDSGPTLVAHELTHRYDSQDGPVRFPVGFAEPGQHTLSLTVVDWSGARDTVVVTIDVVEGGTESNLNGWSATTDGWTYSANVELTPDEYGACDPFRNRYDPAVHDLRAEWPLIFFMDDILVDVTWENARDPLTGALEGNLNDVDATMGHCGHPDGAWERFDADTNPGSTPGDGGEVDGGEFVEHLEVSGSKSDRAGTWRYNAYLSDDGTGRGGVGTTATVSFTFVPATDTRLGGQ